MNKMFTLTLARSGVVTHGISRAIEGGARGRGAFTPGYSNHRKHMAKVVSQTVHVDRSGGRLSVLMTAGNAAPGHYSLTLLEHDAFTVVKDFGIVKFGSEAANTHVLPGSAADNDGRFLQAVTSVGIVDQNRDYAVFMDVVQGGQKVGTISDHGPDTGGTSDTVESELDGAISASPAAELTASASKMLAAKVSKVRTANAKRAKTKKTIKSKTKALVKAAEKDGGK